MLEGGIEPRVLKARKLLSFQCSRIAEKARLPVQPHKQPHTASRQTGSDELLIAQDHIPDAVERLG